MRGDAPHARPEGGALALAVLASIFLPPLGVFLTAGIGRSFWISVALTLIGFLPGLIFALYAIFAPRPPAV